MTISFSKEETEQDFLESLIENLDQYRKSLYGHFIPPKGLQWAIVYSKIEMIKLEDWYITND